MTTIDDGLVPIEEVAKHFRVSVSTVRVWMRVGYIPRSSYLKIGSTYRFSIKKIVDYLNEIQTDENKKEQGDEKKLKPPVQLEFDFYSNPDKDI